MDWCYDIDRLLYGSGMIECVFLD
uniref:Uncharacterized protein n=1 Tax=Rhizophora mucronata TaxID=61149 RepID=A0A2P2QI16_RHIMU